MTRSSTGFSEVGAIAEEKSSTLCYESGGNTTGGAGDSGGSDRSVGENMEHQGTAEDDADHVNEHVPEVPPSLSIARKRLAHSTGGTCHHRCAPVVFAHDLTHSEVDALLGSKLGWQNPFKV